MLFVTSGPDHERPLHCVEASHGIAPESWLLTSKRATFAEAKGSLVRRMGNCVGSLEIWRHPGEMQARRASATRATREKKSADLHELGRVSQFGMDSRRKAVLPRIRLQRGSRILAGVGLCERPFMTFPKLRFAGRALADHEPGQVPNAPNASARRHDPLTLPIAGGPTCGRAVENSGSVSHRRGSSLRIS
jgi:hypothetical protein